ncbi:MAG TPA: hypothetical protein VFS34_10415 [Thermoanaerobaculia bacterium]|nr:hypothetical protein [Thermoanaerobaculia bacterium]
MLFGATSALGQATSDHVPASRTEPVAKSVQADLDQNRYHLGPVRLFPFLEVDNAGYNNNIFGTADHKVADETATVSAGTRLLLPVGSKVYLRGTAAPEYIWYAHHADGRTWGGDYQGELLGLFNHLRLGVDARDTKTASLLNAETLRNVISRTKIGHASGEIDVAGPLSIFGEGEGSKYRFEAIPEPPQPLEDPALLDRKEEKIRVGLRLHSGETLSFSASAEKTRAEFDDSAQGGDNRTVAYLLGVLYDRPRFFANLSAGYRDAKPIHGSRFEEFRTATGSYFLSFLVRSNFELFADGYRGAQYSVTVENPYYMATVNGGGVNFQVAPRLALRLYGDYEENRYPLPVVIDGAAYRRLDRVASVGGGFQIRAGRKLVFGAYGTEYRFDSNVPGVARNVFRVTAAIGFELSPIVSIHGGLS